MDEPVVEVACAIRPFLHQLLPPAEADELDRSIASVLNADDDGDPTSELQVLLERHEATSDFMAEVLDDAPNFRPAIFQTRILRDFNYSGLPGDPSPAYAGKFGCPNGDYVWYRPTSGTPIPACPTHGVALNRLA